MEEITYVFIDGGYLRERAKADLENYFGETSTLDFTKIAGTINVRKSFYYDCLDTIQGREELEADFKTRVAEQESYFNTIRAIPGFHVRLGVLAGEKRRQQKEVDVLLAVDMMNHAIRKNMTKAVLIAGDRDFKPVVESLIQMGVWVEVWSSVRYSSEQLRHAADSWVRITIRRLYSWCSDDFIKGRYCPSEGKWHPPADLGEKLREGIVNGNKFGVTRHSRGSCWAYFPETEDLLVKARDQNELEKYIRAEYGEITWSD